ncbi:glycosyl transferase [Candidatus Roizmanbacteria bacterium CG_4_10_14_0_2_um_filter_36_9]|uniref:Glycosyl transferase n=1 Tax=Candidatus Roizmanbacteria bacterium CG_4_10_14_0_2_um_filter_36_9 TaxID=1974823 RepID=A0A2M7U490_9BACT|nr:MAG: glycosyl transferase [Candidatus Roizmanbacteria bacterium CG_4_10_14_0_2_um_filter_36_9]
MRLISIIIPTFNEQDFIITTLKSVIDQKIGKYKKEIIVIDDGSTDDTCSIIGEFAKNKKISLKLLINKSNIGKSASLRKGFMASKGDIVLVQDADLEYLPEDYPLLLQPFTEGKADVVYGSRFISHAPHRVLYFWHSIGNNILTFLSNIATNLNLTDMETGYKVFRGDLIRMIAPKLSSSRFGFEPEITARIAKIKGIRIYEVGVSYSGRTYDQGKKIRWHDGIKAVYEIIKYNYFSS